MAGDVGELFVRVRPDTAGFKSEADGDVRSAGTSLGKLFVAAFAAVGIGDLIKKSVEAAAAQQSTFAVLGKTVENAGAANKVHGETVDNLVKQQAALKGFSVGDEATAFGKLVSVTKNSAEAFKLLGTAEDLARGTGKDLTTSALAVQKAYEGSATSLARYGIIIKPVVTAVEALAKAHAAAADAGVTFTASEQAAYAVQVKNATLQDKILTGQEAIAAIQQRFGGEATTFAATASGEWDRLRVSVEELGVTIGSALLPPLTSAATDLAKWAQQVTQSTAVQNAAKTAGHDLGVVISDIGDAVRTVGPPLEALAKDAYGVVSAVGAPEILIAVAAYKAFGIASAGASAAQKAWAATLPGASAAEVTEAEAMAQLTAALTANTAAMAGSREAVAETIPIYSAYGNVLSTVTAQEAAAAAGAEETAAAQASSLSRLGSLGVGALGGSVGALTLGVAGLAGGIAYLAAHENTWNAANNAVQNSVTDLTQALHSEDTTVGALSSKFAAIATVAQGQLAGSISNLASKTNEAIATFGHASEFTGQWLLALDKQRVAFAATDPVLSHDILLLEELMEAMGKVPPTTDIQLLINNQTPNASLASIIGGVTQISQFLSGLGSAAPGPTAPVGLAVASPFAARISPASEAQNAAQLAVQNAAAGVKDDVTHGKTHTILTEAAQLAVTQLQQGIALATSQQADLDQQMQDAVQQGAISVQQAVQQAQQSFITIGQNLASDIGTYIDTPLTLTGNALQLQADRLAAIQQNLVTRFAQQNAVLDQETNQISLRSAELSLHEEAASIAIPGKGALSKNPATALKELEGLYGKASPAGKFALQQVIDTYQSDVIAVKKAQDEIITGALNVKTARQAADIAGQQAHLKVLQDIATNEKTAATNSINDWAAEWETKKITLTKFNQDVAALIKNDIGGLGKVAGVPGGYAIEQQIKGQLTGLAQQALAIQQGPQQLGAGFIPQITHPLTALQNEQKQIASIAQQQRANANTILTDLRTLLKDIYGAQKNTAGLTSLDRSTAAQLRAKELAALSGLGR